MNDSILLRLFEASIQGLIAIAVVWLITLIFRNLSPNMRCWLWRLCGVKLAISMVGIIGLPLLPPEPPLLYEVGDVGPSMAVSVLDQPITTQALPSPGSPEPLNLPQACWVVGMAGFAGYRAVGVWRGRKLVRELQATPTNVSTDLPNKLGLRSMPSVLGSEKADSPFLVGLVNPKIVLPRSMLADDKELEMALAHELSHIKRRDIFWQAILAVIGIVFWFLIPIHWVARIAKAEAEMACDRLAVDLTQTNPSSYGRLLVRLATPSTIPSGALGMAARARRHLERRLTAMNRRCLGPRVWILAAVSILCLPALLPWQAVAQKPTEIAPKSEKLEQLARQYLFLPKTEVELGVTAEQRKLLEEYGIKSDKEWRAFGQKLEDMKRAGVSDKDRIAYDQKIRMPMYRRNRDERWNVLTPTQKQRQYELILQYFGPMILGNSEIARQVDLPEQYRKAVAEVEAEYQLFMKRQRQKHEDWVRLRLWSKEIKIRDFTPAENRRLTQINKAIHTASGNKRVSLQQEYYMIRRRGVRYESKDIDHKDFAKRLAESTDKMMDARRKEFARLSARAEGLIPRAALDKWVKTQGKPFAFQPWGEKGQSVISYR